MPRKYEKVQSLMPEIKKMAEQGFTQREIAQELGLSDKMVVKEALRRERKKKYAGIPKQRRRKPAKTLQEYKYENKRLKMEVEFLRDFLSLTERK